MGCKKSWGFKRGIGDLGFGMSDFGLFRCQILDCGFRIDERNGIDFIFDGQLALDTP